MTKVFVTFKELLRGTTTLEVEDLPETLTQLSVPDAWVEFKLQGKSLYLKAAEVFSLLVM